MDHKRIPYSKRDSGKLQGTTEDRVDLEQSTKT